MIGWTFHIKYTNGLAFPHSASPIGIDTTE